MKRLSKKIILLLYGDLVLCYSALFLVVLARYASRGPEHFMRPHLLPFTIIFAVWIFSFGASGLYELRLMKNGKIFLYRLLRIMGINTILAITLLYLFPFEIEPRRNLFLIAGIATVLIFAWRYLFNLLIIRTTLSRVLFLGINKETIELTDFLLANPQIGHQPAAFVTANGWDGQTLPEVPHFSLTEKRFAQIAREVRPELVVISREMKSNREVVKVLLRAIPLGIATVEFPAFHEMLTGKIPLSLIEEVWFLENLIGIKKYSYELTKRILDLALVGITGIMALLTFPFVAIAIKLDSRGPIFFRQTRIGMHGTPFQLIKYRSMVNGADKISGYKSDGPDTRHTRIGAFLRASYLDELPQIINILRGEMSFIGPRPERPEYITELQKKIPFYDMRLLVTPGITGWAQVNMEDDASVEDAPKKMQYDLYYIKNRSPILDLLIALRTLAAIIRRQGR